LPHSPSGDDGAGFAIVASRTARGARTLVSPDIATCAACLAEMSEPGDRRYRHPFITCTDCGPRFTIIRDLPYDRPATTMAGFAMCDDCAREYENPADRRFHAQPIACRSCGPVLWFEHDGARIDGGDAALAAAQRALADGLIVAVKGVGGYHLACRADDAVAVARLRERKSRSDKPFALLARDLATAREMVSVSADEECLLTGPARPIVLLRRRPDAPVVEGIAAGNPLLGVLLPYSPVHHLLMTRVPGSDAQPPAVLVMTSANISDEPLCYADADAVARLPYLADAVLSHDRPIHVPCDDSVVRVVGDGVLPIRRSRGYAPLPVPLGSRLPATLAVGAELKNTFCLIDGDNAFVSAHIGDMGSLDTTRAFDRAVAQLTTLHRVVPTVIAADAHPGYQTRAWAERHGGGPDEPPVRLVQHHHAHVVSLLAEHGRVGQPVIGVAFDGTGYGDDATVWGGEVLLVGADATSYVRTGHLLPVALPGGDAAVRNPCRTALAYLSAAGVEWAADLGPVRACDRTELAVVGAQLAASAGTVSSTSMGRLFDAVASLLDVRHRVGYEGQAAIELEILAGDEPPPTEPACGRFAVDDGGVIDHRPVLRAIVAGLRGGVSRSVLAHGFHLAVAVAVADAVAEHARAVADRTGVGLVGLTGGVFQNVLLAQACRERLEAAGLAVLTHRLVPPNDGGLALGQAVIAAMSTAAIEADEPRPVPADGRGGRSWT
jgi:hydrogenase maturation protein HypF